MPPSHTQGHVQEHIELIARHEQDFLARRTRSEKIADRISAWIGSLAFITFHAVVFAGWIVWNSVVIGGLPHFDPFPYPLLDFIFAFEAILITSFILMRQSRMSRRSEERDQLMLQVLLLSEREITAVLGMERQIAERMGLRRIAEDEEITQLSQQTSIDEVAQILQDTLPVSDG